MDRAEKENLVASLHRTFSETAVVLVTHYSGLTVAEIVSAEAMRVHGDRAAGGDQEPGLHQTRAGSTPPREGLASGIEAGLFKGRRRSPTTQVVIRSPAAKVRCRLREDATKSWSCWAVRRRDMLDARGVKALAALAVPRRALQGRLSAGMRR